MPCIIPLLLPPAGSALGSVCSVGKSVEKENTAKKILYNGLKVHPFVFIFNIRAKDFRSLYNFTATQVRDFGQSGHISLASQPS